MRSRRLPTSRSNMLTQARAIAGENICIDGGVTRSMIYHNDFGWRLEK